MAVTDLTGYTWVEANGTLTSSEPKHYVTLSHSGETFATIDSLQGSVTLNTKDKTVKDYIKVEADVSDTNLVPENIKQGVSIFGVNGSYAGITPTGEKSITSTASTDVTNYATARIDSTSRTNLVAGNIKSGVTILGVTGTLSAGKVIVYSSGCSKITNNTSMTATNATVTIPETGNYKFTWFHYAYAYSSSYYNTRLYRGSTAIGTQKNAPTYSGTPEAATENSISCTAGDVITVRAKTRSGTSYWTCVCGLIAEKL